MIRQWVIARDHKTDLNRPREYRTEPGTTLSPWTTDKMAAHKFTVLERNVEFKWIKQNTTAANWDVFYYKD